MNSSVVDIELTPSSIKKLADGQIINNPMRPRRIANVGIKLRADTFDVMDALIEAMLEGGSSAEDIKTAVSEKLKFYE